MTQLRSPARLKQVKIRYRTPWLPAAALAVTLTSACDQGSPLAAQCQALMTDLDARQRVLLTTVSGEPTLENVLQHFNDWLLTWDNGLQQMRALAVLSAKGLSRAGARECQTALRFQQRQLFSQPELLTALNGLELSEQATSTQHFVNKLRQEFIRNGATLEASSREKLLQLHRRTLEMTQLGRSDIQAWFETQTQVADILGLPRPLTLARSQQMLPINAMVGDYLQSVRAELASNAQTATAEQTLDLSFTWDTVKQGLGRLAQTLFAIELLAAEPTDTFFYDELAAAESFHVFANGQQVGELIFSIRWHDQPGANHLDYFALQRGIAGGQQPRFLIAGDFYGVDPTRVLNHAQLVAVLHQFGHFLHHQLAGAQQWSLNAGLAAEQDFLEAPAMLFEYWGWSSDGLSLFQRQSLSAADAQSLAVQHGQQRQQLRRALLDYATALEQWFGLPASEKQDASPTFEPGLNLPHNHCQQHPAIAYRCLAAQDIAGELIQGFVQFGFEDVQTAARLRKEVLAPGGSRPALDMIGVYLNRSYTLY